MKLHQTILAEATGPIPYELTLGEVIRDGDVTNNYQVLILSTLSEFFKGGGQNIRALVGPVPFSSGATSVDAIESIKSLTPSEKVKLATYLLDCIQSGESAPHSISLSSADWIRFVLQRQP